MFLMYVGGVQFVYACLTGGYPFNSFLAGFTAAVGQFVLAGMISLTISLLSSLNFYPISSYYRLLGFIVTLLPV